MPLGGFLSTVMSLNMQIVKYLKEKLNIFLLSVLG